MGFFSDLFGFGQPAPQQNEQSMSLQKREEFAKSRTDYSDMNCMSCKFLHKDSSGFYCSENKINKSEISADRRQFGFYDPYKYDENNNVILLQNNCEASYYWQPRRLNSDGMPILNDCNDVS